MMNLQRSAFFAILSLINFGFKILLLNKIKKEWFMLRSSLFFVIIFLGLSAFASAVKIKTFRFLNSGSSFSAAAELCGELVAPTGKPEMVKIVSDPTSKVPGNYFAWTGKDGKFCSVIATYTGNAEADLE